MNYDIVIAGCGFTGAVIAFKSAMEGKRVLIVEKRNHIAGNMYDYIDEAGICVQKYGPHSFHTNNEEVYEFITQIGDWYEYILRARVMIDGKYTPSPFNFKTIDQYYPAPKAEMLKQALVEYYNSAKKVTVVELLESDNELIREYASFLFEKDYRPYTAKQWGIAPEELDISILKRVPVRLDYTDGYFDDKYQLMPEGGFTSFFEKMLSNPLIDIRLNCDVLDLVEIDGNNIIFENELLNVPFVYTGPLDELFRYKYGKLPYRSLKFDMQIHNVDSYQETSGVAYPMAEGYTRITEYKKIPVQDIKGKTTIAVEYPVTYGTEEGKEPYYPILTENSKEMYKRYCELASKVNRLYVCGRLGDFKYYNMDDAVLRALEVYEDIRKTYLWREA